MVLASGMACLLRVAAEVLGGGGLPVRALCGLGDGCEVLQRRAVEAGQALQRAGPQLHRRQALHRRVPARAPAARVGAEHAAEALRRRAEEALHLRAEVGRDLPGGVDQKRAGLQGEGVSRLRVHDAERADAPVAGEQQRDPYEEAAVRRSGDELVVAVHDLVSCVAHDDGQLPRRCVVAYARQLQELRVQSVAALQVHPVRPFQSKEADRHLVVLHH
mmetsp:Transcript_54761/g.159742  ORF Transcript_54761/g.159742 Transcript_54761/m.159742 type:complete len:218 (-) Transcript_54761:251-904(-)